MCRIILPAIVGPDEAVHVISTLSDNAGTGIAVRFYTEGKQGRSRNLAIHCQFEGGNNTVGHFVLKGLNAPQGEMSATQLYFLDRFWLKTDAAWVSDPEPVAGAERALALPPTLAYALQQILNALPLAAIYALLAAAYSLVYGLVGRINLAFGEFAAVGGYAAIFGVMLGSGGGSFTAIGLALALGIACAIFHGVVAGRLMFAPLANSGGQTMLVATVGLALFLQEYLRLTQGASLRWVGPILNTPVPVARAPGFVVTVTQVALLSAGIAALAACALLMGMRFSRFGREWRAFADDARAAMLFGVNPSSIFATTFALACAFAGLSGSLMTLFYGAFGYGASTALGLKALVAAILGGIGSVSGALLGGLAIGFFEAFWLSYFAGEYRDLAVYLILIGLLMFRPGGFFGFGDLRPRQV